MQDYGNFVPAALKESSDQSLAALGNKLDLFPFEVEYDPFFKASRHDHVLIETYSYLKNLQKQYNATRYTYLMKEQVTLHDCCLIHVVINTTTGCPSLGTN